MTELFYSYFDLATKEMHFRCEEPPDSGDSCCETDIFSRLNSNGENARAKRFRRADNRGMLL